MSKRTKGCLIGGIVLYGLLAAIIVLVMAFQRQDLHSAATASRNTVGFKDGHFGLLEPANRETRATWPAMKAMREPARFEGDKGAFLYDFSKEIKPGTVTPPSAWSEGFLGDDGVELVAFATWIPRSDDPLKDSKWMTTLTLRDPVTLEAIDASRRSGLGLPESFANFLPPQHHQTPVLRLVFRTKGIEYPRATRLEAGDGRTGAQVTYNLKDEDDGSARHEVSGEWLRIDTNLLLWHDTPLKCQVRFLTGEPEILELPSRPGAEVAFGDRLRLQWLTATKEVMKMDSWFQTFEPAPSLSEKEKEDIRKLVAPHSGRRDRLVAFSPENPPQASPRVYVRASSQNYLVDHCGVAHGSGVTWGWGDDQTNDGVLIASIHDKTPGSPLRLVFIPSMTEWTGEIPGLPDMPNPRSTEDLFDCVLPRITVPEDPDTAETHLLGFIGVAAQLAWKSNEIWDEHPPLDLPEDRTFRNTTPQQLLDWYLDHTPGAYVRYDEAELVLHFNEEEGSSWKRLTEGARTLYYEILYGSPPP